MGYLIKHNNFIANMIEGKIDGPEERGKPRNTFIEIAIEMVAGRMQRRLSRNPSAPDNYFY